MESQSLTAGTQPGKRPGFFRLLWRAVRQVFHETTGTLFLLLGVSWTAATLRLWRQGAGHWVLGACAGFALMMLGFGLTSFRSARRVR